MARPIPSGAGVTVLRLTPAGFTHPLSWHALLPFPYHTNPTLTGMRTMNAFSWTASPPRHRLPAALILRGLTLTLLLSVLSGPCIHAQEEGEKPPLTIAEYRLWRTISGAT